MEKEPKALRLIAALEASKGILALIVGFTLHELGSVEIQKLFVELVSHLHLNPSSQLPGAIYHAIHEVNNNNITLIAAGTVLYASVRMVEAYGLWHAFAWTEWFAMASGAIYFPFEIDAVITRGHWLDWAALLINLVVVAYMATLILNRRKAKKLGV